MTYTDTEEEEKEQGPHLVWTNPNKATGGGFTPTDKDWLTPLPISTEFLCGRPDMVYLQHYEVVFHSPAGNVRLLLIEDESRTYHWVHPLYFCSIMELKEIR